MGAGHCPWGGYTDRIVCNIHGEGRLASRYRAMIRPETFPSFGTLPAPGDLSRWSPLSFYSIWQTAKISWHAAKRTSPDRLRSWIDRNLAPITKSRCNNLLFLYFYDLDLWPWTLIYQKSACPPIYQKSCPYVHWPQQERWLRTDGRMDTQNHRPLLWICMQSISGTQAFDHIYFLGLWVIHCQSQLQHVQKN